MSQIFSSKKESCRLCPVEFIWFSIAGFSIGLFLTILEAQFLISHGESSVNSMLKQSGEIDAITMLPFTGFWLLFGLFLMICSVSVWFKWRISRLLILTLYSTVAFFAFGDIFTLINFSMSFLVFIILSLYLFKNKKLNHWFNGGTGDMAAKFDKLSL